MAAGLWVVHMHPDYIKSLVSDNCRLLLDNNMPAMAKGYIADPENLMCKPWESVVLNMTRTMDHIYTFFGYLDVERTHRLYCS
jgi:hypothetical protein